MGPVCTLMVGRLDDRLKQVARRDDLVIDPAHLEWAGVAAVKKACWLCQERGYRTHRLSAATRNHMHWPEFIGGNVVVTLTHPWQKRFNRSAIAVMPRMDTRVDDGIVQSLQANFEDFRRVYDPEGMRARKISTRSGQPAGRCAPSSKATTNSWP